MQWMEERLRRGPVDGSPGGGRVLFHEALLRRSRRSRPSPLVRLSVWENSPPRYRLGFSIGSEGGEPCVAGAEVVCGVVEMGGEDEEGGVWGMLILFGPDHGGDVEGEVGLVEGDGVLVQTVVDADAD